MVPFELGRARGGRASGRPCGRGFVATNGAPLRVVVHHPGRIQPGTQQALAQERLHHRTNDPPYRPAPLEMYLLYVYCPPAEPHAYGDSLRALWERGQPFIGQSVIVSYTGWPIGGPASPEREEIIYAEVNLADARRKRNWNEYNQVLRDRRVDVYGEMLGATAVRGWY